MIELLASGKSFPSALFPMPTGLWYEMYTHLFSAKRGWSAMSMSPAIVLIETTFGVPFTGSGCNTPLRTRRRRPTRSVMSMSPGPWAPLGAGRNATLHGCDKPLVTTDTRMWRCSYVSKSNGPSPSGGLLYGGALGAGRTHHTTPL